MGRPYTAEEAREHFLEYVRHIARYWANVEQKADLERCEGVAFSLLNILDGNTRLPSFDLVLSPHPDDKAYHQQRSENWYEPGMLINNCSLHEMFYRKEPTDADGWIPYAGVGRPVDPNVLVEVKFRNGEASVGDESREGSGWIWGHDGDPGDIIAYRIAGEKK